MANTYTQVYIHLVFAVKKRLNLIHSNFKEEVYKYISGIIRNKKQKLYAINGMPDHVHIFLSMTPDISISDLVRDIKSNSGKFVNERKFVKGRFEWQTGFGAFSYSHSQIDSVVKYIQNQEKHHLKQSFKEEYLELLKNFNVDYDVKYIFDFD